MIVVVYGLTCKLYTHIVLRNPRPQSDSNWDNWRGWLWCEDHMCSLSVNALLWYFIKRSTLITSSFPWGPAANRLVGQKMSYKFLIASMYEYIRNTCLWLLSTRILYHYLSAIVHVLLITLIILSMQHPYIHPYAYCLLLLPLSSLLYYCCYYFTTVTTIKLLLLINRCEQVCFQVQLNWQLIC
jgi:succinate dehydrogenase/fumarate reductase cytochrome b subunit